MSDRTSNLAGVLIGLTVASAAALVVSLFLNWYEVSGPSADTSVTLTGWDALETLDALLVLAACGSLVCAAAQRWAGLALIGLITLVLVVVVVVTQTPTLAIAEESGVLYTDEVGLFLAVAASAVLSVAGAVGLWSRRADPHQPAN